ncbi:MAPEG family protein [uncultured Roseibium sp.]|uniref:MAPEG family protein n=1 Tax=uncultured Roseibium sp. TaxID=1936171 RepID=UPI00260E5A79|nr:MAPEG family protein [uncultured Roseibium sp.]
MENLFEAAPFLNAYRPGLTIVAALSLIVLIQNFLTAPLAFAKEEQIPGMPLQYDHTKLSFRAVRTYQNSAESFPAFLAAVLIAIIAGVSPLLVNVAAGIYLAARLLFWGVYYAGVGRVAGGPRTIAFVVCLLANIVIAVAALIALY